LRSESSMLAFLWEKRTISSVTITEMKKLTIIDNI
jgi:hypothetical protein